MIEAKLVCEAIVNPAELKALRAVGGDVAFAWNAERFQWRVMIHRPGAGDVKPVLVQADHDNPRDAYRRAEGLYDVSVMMERMKRSPVPADSENPSSGKGEKDLRGSLERIEREYAKLLQKNRELHKQARDAAEQGEGEEPAIPV